jgi:hypothetical protein
MVYAVEAIPWNQLVKGPWMGQKWAGVERPEQEPQNKHWKFVAEPLLGEVHGVENGRELQIHRNSALVSLGRSKEWAEMLGAT